MQRLFSNDYPKQEPPFLQDLRIAYRGKGYPSRAWLDDFVQLTRHRPASLSNKPIDLLINYGPGSELVKPQTKHVIDLLRTKNPSLLIINCFPILPGPEDEAKLSKLQIKSLALDLPPSRSFTAIVKHIIDAGLLTGDRLAAAERYLVLASLLSPAGIPRC